MKQSQDTPNENIQNNIGNLATHYVDKFYTHLERLTQNRRISEAQSLMRNFEQEMRSEATNLPDASEIAKISAYYLKKLTGMMQLLLDADRIKEAQNLKTYCAKINERKINFEKNLQRLTNKLPKRKF
jgi:hypothetical protein